MSQRHLIPRRIREYALSIYNTAIKPQPVDRNLQLYVTLLAHAEHLLMSAPVNSPWWKKTNENVNKREALAALRQKQDMDACLNLRYPPGAYVYGLADRERKFKHLYKKCPAPFFLTYIVDNQLTDEIAALKSLCSMSSDDLPEIQVLPNDCGLSLETLSSGSGQIWLRANIEKPCKFSSVDHENWEWGGRNKEGQFVLANDNLLADFEDRYTLRPVFVTEHQENAESLQPAIEQGEIDYLLEELKHLVGIEKLASLDRWSICNKELQLKANDAYRYARGEVIAAFSISECLDSLRRLLPENRLHSQAFGDAVWTAPIGGYAIPWRSNWSKLANRDIYIFKFGECASDELSRELLDVSAAIIRDAGNEIADRLNFVILLHKTSVEVSQNNIQLLNLDEFFKEYVSDETPVPDGLESIYEEYLRRSKRKSQNPYIVDPVIRRGSWCLLTGEEGTGKTYLGMALGAAIAGNGKLFWNWKVRRRNCKVLYITDDEMSTDIIQNRLAVLKRLYPSSKKRFFVEQVKHLSLLDDNGKDDQGSNREAAKETGKEKIEKLLTKYSRVNGDSPVEVLFLDHLLKLSEAEGDQKEHWPKIRSWIEELTRRGLSVVLLHHEYGGGKMLGTRLIANDTPARIHLQALHTLKPRTKSEEKKSDDFKLEEDEIGFGLSIIKNRGGRDQKEPKILKLNIGMHPDWISDKKSSSGTATTSAWKSLNKEERISRVRELRDSGDTNVSIAKALGCSKSSIEKCIAEFPDNQKRFKVKRQS